MENKEPKILDCAMNDCAFNKNQECHAFAITVGGPHPMCETFFEAGQKGGVSYLGMVGACKMNNCMYNKSFECSAQGIHVGMHARHPDCMTFKKK